MMNLPPRNKGDHWCIGHLVQLEAQRMVSMAPYTGGAGKHSAEAERLNRVEENLWSWVRSGWTRLRDDGILVHWHPDAGDHVPFTRALHDYYTSSGNDIMTWYRHVADQRGGFCE